MLTLGDTALSRWCCIKQTAQVSVSEWEGSQAVGQWTFSQYCFGFD